ncbi:MAG: PTS transporter subunit EIIB, partial [Lactobacillus sp.]|nr:PTS transporter subunit EIIB [Lactobacillus sp.]
HLVSATTTPTLEKATGFVDLLGGPANIQDLSACATRLRVRVVDADKVGDETAFKQLKAFSVVKKSDHEIEIVTGLDADEVLAEMKGLL